MAEQTSKEKKKLEKLAIMRHSMSHVMAAAVLRLFPTAQFAIGPSIENGFYYDFDLSRSLTEGDLEAISEIMKEIIKENRRFEFEEMEREKALEFFKDQPYKIELIHDLSADEAISVYKMGDFVDLCRGPHVEETGRLNAQGFKLLSVAGAYWRGDEKRQMLQRIYGTAFGDPKQLRAHLEHLEELKKRDHRLIGKQQDLFSWHEEAGPGLAYWHPKGGRMRTAIENFWREEHYKNGYELVVTPHVGKKWLWEKSGHLGFYKESMYNPMEMDKDDYYCKPMNCPFHIMIYNDSKKSYRDLPCRWAELGTVYRYEKSGTLHGLTRVRGFTQDDAHIICTPEQMDAEISEVLQFSLYMLKAFDFTDVSAYLSTRPDGKCVGSEKDWESAQEALKGAIERAGLAYNIDEGGGAFYGPKIDLKVKDSMGREWQLSTIQFDFNLPQRFNMKFVDKDGTEKQPYMIHRALLGSLERFFGVMIENYGGAYPVWLCPTQVQVIPVGHDFDEYSKEVWKKLRAVGIRAEIDTGDDNMKLKIRKAQEQKIPYMCILGAKEQEAGTVSFRIRSGAQKNGLCFAEALKEIQEKIDKKEQP
ncbi:MAG TPA: threonine--tRNA ligase [Treponemataceae bacterium]|nr:threonine--tRNA ligase [Treponemataceae bacterium]